MTPDVGTILLISTAVELLGAFLLFLFVTTSPTTIDRRSAKSLRVWITSFLICGIGYAALMTRGITPDWFSQLFANALFLVAADFRRIAVAKFWGGSSKWLFGVLPTALWVTLYCIPAFRNNFPAIIFYLHATLFVIAAGTSYQIFRCNGGRLRTANWLGCAYIAAACTHFYVAFSAFLPEHSYLQPFSSIEVIGGYLSIILITLFANIVLVFALVTEREQLKFQELAQVDPLTGLDNRRAFLDEANRWLDQHAEHGSNFAVIMIDLDHFKMVNDTHGHAVGDKVLKIAANVLKAELPRDAVIGRMGEEEFAVLLKSSPQNLVVTQTEHIRHEFGKAVQERLHGEVSVTLSAGYHIENTANCCPLNTALTHADRALYQAKHAGRNRVACSQKPKLNVSSGPSRLPDASALASPTII